MYIEMSYDNTNIQEIWKVLYRADVCTGLMERIKNIFNGMVIDGKKSKSFQMFKGIR
jgi:hypothetical protein